MSLGTYYYQNQKKLCSVSDTEWRVAIHKTKRHISLKVKQKTLSGVHAGARLGAEALDHYLGISYEKIINGNWEWKETFSLAEQMIRIVDSEINKEVEKSKTVKAKEMKLISTPSTEDFYSTIDAESSEDDSNECEKQLKIVEAAAKEDIQLEIMLEAVKEGKKRAEIADLLEINPKQLDKLREKLIAKARTLQSAAV